MFLMANAVLLSGTVLTLSPAPIASAHVMFWRNVSYCLWSGKQVCFKTLQVFEMVTTGVVHIKTDRTLRWISLRITEHNSCLTRVWNPHVNVVNVFLFSSNDIRHRNFFIHSYSFHVKEPASKTVGAYSRSHTWSYLLAKRQDHKANQSTSYRFEV